MEPRTIPEIAEAIDLLKECENAPPLSEDIGRKFLLGIDGLEGHLTKNRDSPHREFIQNVKVAYTRSLLKRLPSLMNKADVRVLGQYIPPVLRVQKEAGQVMDEYPEVENALYDLQQRVERHHLQKK